MTIISAVCPGSAWFRVMLLWVTLLGSAAVHANPANCDGDMTEDQRFQASLCSAHAGCRFVFGIADTCVKAKSFLSRLGLGGKGSATAVTDDRVSSALTESGVPRPGISSCLIDFDRTKCSEYLSGGPKQPGAREQADEIVERLKGKVYDTTVWDAGLGLAKEGLRMCDDATSEANMRDAVRAKERCALADGNINACLSTKDGHEELRKRLQGLVDSGDLGADAAGYRSLASTSYPTCPTTLPGSGKTPKVALADYLKFWDTPEERKTKPADPTGPADGIAGLMEKGISKVGDWFSKTFTSEQKSPASKEEENSKREAGSWVDKNLADTQARADSERLERVREAERVANQTPAERLTNSYDQRIANARQQCAASENTCQKGCIAVGAVGLLGILFGNGAGSNVASAQVEQCSNRCDQAKSSCEQAVSTLEQEKAQAINETTRGPSAGASANTVTSGATGANAGGRTGTVTAGGDKGLPIEECQRQESASDVGRKLSALPAGNTNLQLRGIVVASDFMIRTYSQCLPNQRAQQIVAQYRKTREDSVRTCRQISSSDNCLTSPF